MRILVASRAPFYPFRLGGAARCAHRLLLRLLARGHEVRVVCGASGSMGLDPSEHPVLGVRSLTGPDPWRADVGYPVEAHADLEGALARALDERPEVVWGQLEGASEILREARRRGLGAIWYLHDANDPAEALAHAVAEGVALVANSEFLRDRVHERVGVVPPVVYPVLDEDVRVTPRPDGFVTLINPMRPKGGEIGLEVARRLPDHRVLFVESWPLTAAFVTDFSAFLERHHPNATLWRRVADVRRIYEVTSILLVPSQWEETHGRVVREAQLSGIPIVASARGGLRETVQGGGLVVEAWADPGAYVAAIREIERDRDGWSRRALEAAHDPRWDPKRAVEAIEVVFEAASRSGRGGAPSPRM